MPTLADKFKNLITDPYDNDEEEEELEEAGSIYEKPANKSVSTMAEAKIISMQPASYEEAKTIADYLIAKKACVVNIHRLQQDHAIRLIDFLSGVIYSIRGSIQKIDEKVYLFSPKDMPVQTPDDEEVSA